MSRAVMQQALDVLEDIGGEWGFISKRTVPKRIEVITALRDELAKPEQEPVRREQQMFMDEQELYAAPPQRQPLTDEDVKTIFDSVPTQSCQSYEHWRSLVARAIEAAHGIKENT